MKAYLGVVWVSAALFSTGCMQGDDVGSGGPDDGSTPWIASTEEDLNSDPDGTGSNGLNGAGGSTAPVTNTGGTDGSGGSDVGGGTGGDTGSNTGGDTGSNTGGASSGTGGDTGSNTGGDTGSDTGGASSGTGGDTGSNTGGTSSGTGGETGSTGGTSGDDRCRLYVDGDVPACCAPQGDNRTNVDEVLALLNTYRNSLGLDSLASDPLLEEAMHAHCIHMDEAGFFSHTSPVDALSSPWDRAELCGARADGENIAKGQRTPAAVMESWRNSSGHDDNMRGNHTLVGIGEYNRNWGQVFK